MIQKFLNFFIIDSNYLDKEKENLESKLRETQSECEDFKNNENICNILDFIDNNNSDFFDYSSIPFLYIKKELKENNKDIEFNSSTENNIIKKNNDNFEDELKQIDIIYETEFNK